MANGQGSSGCGPAMGWDEWATHDATSLAALVRKGEITAREIAAQVAEGTARVDPKLAAVLGLFDDMVANPDTDGPAKGGLLYAVSVFVKDLARHPPPPAIGPTGRSRRGPALPMLSHRGDVKGTIRPSGGCWLSCSVCVFSGSSTDKDVGHVGSRNDPGRPCSVCGFGTVDRQSGKSRYAPASRFTTKPRVRASL